MGPKLQEKIVQPSVAMKHGDTFLGKAFLQRCAAWVCATAVCVSGTVGAVPAPGSVDVYLQTQSFIKTLPGGATVPMWGFASCTDSTYTNCAVPDAPGTQIEAFADRGLNINVSNTLNVPVSVVIPGQLSAGSPTFDTDGRGRQRVRSFTHEVAPGTTGQYSWSAANNTTNPLAPPLQEGTYLYQSGSYPSIQVPMGLYGALVVHPQSGSPAAISCAADAATGNAAYGSRADSCYKTETTLLLSEIDPVQNAAVDAAADVVSYPSTMNYNPTYLLVNGKGADAGALSAVSPGDRVLLRFLNAGLNTHNPSIVGLELGMLAEDGNPHPGTIKQQSVAMLAAGKTLDVLATMPTADITLALYDRKPAFSNNALDAALPGGVTAMGQLKVGAGSPVQAPVVNLAVDDSYAVTEDTALSIANLQGVLANDNGLANASVFDAPLDGALVLNADGSFTYTPNANFSGTDRFTYKALNAGGNAYVAQVVLNVSFENDVPVAAADTYTNIKGGSVSVVAPGVLGNDRDDDGDPLTAVLDVAPTNLPAGSIVLNVDGSFSLTAAAGEYDFSYHSEDGVSSSAPVNVHVSIKAAAGIALTVQEPDGTPVTAYRWTVQEDRMWHPDPSVPQADSLATNMHKSYMPVIAQGCVDASPNSINCPNPFTLAEAALDPTKHYYVSVLPFDAAMALDPAGNGGHTMGGQPIAPGDTAVTVNVNLEPMGYAQITAMIFNDDSPTNGAHDGNEGGLGGFTITLEDGGGRYGMASGLLSKDANGNPLKNYLNCFGATPPPEGVILTCPDTPANRLAGVVGQVQIKNLFPGKYGVIATPPADSPNQWLQTTTIEGTIINDAWVKANEPAYFAEFGPAGLHNYTGFVSPDKVASDAITNGLVGGNTIRGAVTNNHMSRPPVATLYDSGTYDALAHTRPWVSLNSASGIGKSIAVVHATLNPDGTATFEIPNVPDGSYQVSIWDDYLDTLMSYSRLITVQGGQTIDIGNVPVFNWFARLESSVFLDLNGNGKRDGAAEVGVPEVPVNLRWRDGSVYQSVPTDGSGEAPFDEMFPFFNWLVAEVDYATHKATGMTATVDHGGDVSLTGHVLNPQVQADDTTSRTEVGTVLTQGIQNFLGQTNQIEWGKAQYKKGENGGISGIVYYAVTRAEADPRLAVAEPWEPGIPGVKVRLYREVNRADGTTGLALVDETVTDSWDNSLPTGCPGADATDPVTPLTKCYDGLRNFNQVRPAVFDGGYAFGRAAGKPDLVPGKYVVEVEPPAGYDLVKEEDVNVGFGETFGAVSLIVGSYPIPTLPDLATLAAARAPLPGIADPKCVGATHVVQPYLNLFPAEMADAPFAGANRNLCDRKEVLLVDEGQAAADFFLYTSTPIAGQFTGIILDDIAQEFDPVSPQFGEKWAPPFVPVSIRDALGKEISRVYSDQWGAYNGLLPSTFSASMPSPSGFSPSMLMTCMNHPGPIPDPNNPGKQIVDPQYNPMYSTFCYTMQYMPGTTTYLDTPVLPVASYASGFHTPDCAEPTQTPKIKAVNGSGVGPLVDLGGTLTITSMGAIEVPNPDYAGPLATTATAAPKTILRDFGFGGTAGTVTLDGQIMAVDTWSDAEITLTIPAGFTSGEYQLAVTRSGGASTTEAITVTVGKTKPFRRPIRVTAGSSIQDAIDNAKPGDLILVEPGVYNESVIMWKPVRLQGAGAGSTIINALKTPVERIQQWRTKMDALFAAGAVNAGSAAFGSDEGAGITVLGLNTNDAALGAFSKWPSRIDGFSITGADIGGGIFVDSYAHKLMISNNHVFGNNGTYGGGIRIGRPFKQRKGNGPFGLNKRVRIHHNAIVQNAGRGGAGGGVSINTGSDWYSVADNFVCGNFSSANGGGIGHFGLSIHGNISQNRIVLNQSFSQGTVVSGGGLFVGGEPAAGGGLTLGSGKVIIDSNLIQGNQAASGHGGGIRTEFVNGMDVRLNPQSKKYWYKLTMINNMVVNNVAGWSGGGISMQDTLVSVVNGNTIAHNDSTATVAGAFTTGNINVSAAQPAGIAVSANSPLLDLMIPNKRHGLRQFSKSLLINNIVWKNRAFNYDATSGTGKLIPELTQTAVGECSTGANYWDIGVTGVPGVLNPKYSVLTDATGYHWSNKSSDPNLKAAYCNGGREVPGPIVPLPAIDEGGNTWIDVRFGPLAVLGDYHIGAWSSAKGSAYKTTPEYDFDGELRTQPNQIGTNDIGSDEIGDGVPDPRAVVTFSSDPYPLSGNGSLLDFGAIDGNGFVITTVTISVTDQNVNIGQLRITQMKGTKGTRFYTIVPGTDSCSNTTVAVGDSCTLDISFYHFGKKDKRARLVVPTDFFDIQLNLLGQ